MKGIGRGITQLWVPREGDVRGLLEGERTCFSTFFFFLGSIGYRWQIIMLSSLLVLLDLVEISPLAVDVDLRGEPRKSSVFLYWCLFYWTILLVFCALLHIN